MKIKLYLPYNTYDDGDFDSKYEMSNDEYFSKMEEENMRNKNIAFDYVNGKRYNTQVTDASWNAGRRYNEGKVRFISAECILHNDEDGDKTVDDFVADCVSQEVGISIAHFLMDAMDEEFEEELNLWNEEHKKINEYIDNMGEDWVFRNEPTKNLRVEYVNNSGETKFAEIVNCRILEKMNKATYALLYDKITFEN